ncbi:hypothetical protein GCM10017559_17270 [Streptosporangium longisporum]|uniref:Uncharacterized protein n=1 Tax=Streptosporangium longisporum TaxID=46187 RepID=A0ABN3XWP2_9ACTN
MTSTAPIRTRACGGTDGDAGTGEGAGTDGPAVEDPFCRDPVSGRSFRERPCAEPFCPGSFHAEPFWRNPLHAEPFSRTPPGEEPPCAEPFCPDPYREDPFCRVPEAARPWSTAPGTGRMGP